MTIEATSSEAQKAALRQRIEAKMEQQQERQVQATEEVTAKEQAMRELAKQDAVKVELSSNSE